MFMIPKSSYLKSRYLKSCKHNGKPSGFYDLSYIGSREAILDVRERVDLK